MTMHTKGPWEVVEHPHAICVRTESPSKTKYGASRYAVIGGFDSNDRAQLEEARANARLIAAAPDLLEALKDMVGLVELMCPFDGPQQRKARATIARATGEQP